jgi:hypothetical protein
MRNHPQLYRRRREPLADGKIHLADAIHDSGAGIEQDKDARPLPGVKGQSER